MNKFLACAGSSGNETAIKRLLEIAKERKPDAILFAGIIANPDANERRKVEFVGKFFESLGKSGQVAIVIPGPQDGPLWEFLRAALNTEVVFPNIMVAHASLVTRGEVAASGIGGLITETEDASTPVIKYSHACGEFLLRSLWHTPKPTKVLLLSEPPPGKLAGSGGNAIVREFIKTYHPNICVVAGKKEHRGYEQEAHGFVVNPGLLSEGSAAWVDRVAKKVEMLDL